MRTVKEWILDQFRWLTFSWYQYLLEDNTGLRNILCRATLHKCGPVFYNCGGLEPNMECRNCGEDLG